jgi:hypothetical protein
MDGEIEGFSPPREVLGQLLLEPLEVGMGAWGGRKGESGAQGLSLSLEYAAIREFEKAYARIDRRRDEGSQGALDPGQADKVASLAELGRPARRLAEKLGEGLSKARMGLVAVVEDGVVQTPARPNGLEGGSQAASPLVALESEAEAILKATPHCGGVEALGPELGIADPAPRISLDTLHELSEPVGICRRGEGPAAQAWTVTGYKGIGRSCIEDYIAGKWLARGAGRTAEDTRRGDGGEEKAVEGFVPIAKGCIHDSFGQ